MEQIDWETAGAVVGLALGLITILYRAPKVYRRLKGWWKTVFGNDAHKVIRDDITALGKQLDLIVAEFMPNGGSSMKDQLNRLESDMALANERQRARMLDTPEMIFETDSEGHCVWVNRTYSKAVQRNFTELLGFGWVNGIAVGDRERVVSEWFKAVEEDREFEMEFQFQDADGNAFPVTCRSYKMRDWRTGEAVGFLGRCDKI